MIAYTTLKITPQIQKLDMCLTFLFYDTNFRYWKKNGEIQTYLKQKKLNFYTEKTLRQATYDQLRTDTDKVNLTV